MGGASRVDAIILQGHLDMVCEKLATCHHNFETDSIAYYIENGTMCTKGTTLGADNGAAISYMLRLLESTDTVHPDLECIFTTKEETGLYEAACLDMSSLKGCRSINLDAAGGGVLVRCYPKW